MPYLLLALLLLFQLAGTAALLTAGLRRAPYQWAAWVLLLLWVEAALLVDRVVLGAGY